MRVSLIVVTHRSAGVLPAAVESFRTEARAAGAEPEVVVVDHSEDGEETARLAAVSPDRLTALPNRGYAAGINAGIERASGEVLFCANPDLRFLAGSVAALLTALERHPLAGPRFELAGFAFPPADLQTPREALGRAAARRSRRAWERRLLSAARHWSDLWTAAEPVPVPQLSGALLAVRRETALRLGPWDEGYFLYFEETDWLRRATALGLSPAVVPAARVEHAWGHAAAPGAAAAGSEARGPVGGRYEASRRRFQARHHPRLGRIADRIATRMAAPDPPRAEPGWPGAAAAPEIVDAPALATGSGRRDLWWLVSPSPWLLPAAGLAASSSPGAQYRRFAAAAPEGTPLTAAAVDLETAEVHGPWRLAASSVE